MNRETKRLMQRQGQVGPDGAPARRQPPNRPAPRPVRERTSPAEYTRQVRAELRKVAWPTRAQVINYSVIVMVALILLTGLIFGLDYVFGKLTFFLFKN
ncbi:MAG: preprotein translocase subunit SecE [Acidimicrobiales bacterium]